MENLDDSNVFDKAEEAANSAISQQLSAVKVLEDLGKGKIFFPRKDFPEFGKILTPPLSFG